MPRALINSITPNIRPSEGAGTTTLTVADSRRQVFNISAARTCVLPSAGIKAGDILVLENISAFDLTVQSSNTSEVTIANGCNQAATIRSGFVELRALQDAPTTPAHWRVTDVFEEYEYAPNITGAVSTGSSAVRLTRHNKMVKCTIRIAPQTASASPEFSTTAVTAPVRMRPALEHRMPCTLYNNSAYVSGLAEIGTGGTLAFRKADATNFSGTSGIGASATIKTLLSWHISD